MVTEKYARRWGVSVSYSNGARALASGPVCCPHFLPVSPSCGWFPEILMRRWQKKAVLWGRSTRPEGRRPGFQSPLWWPGSFLCLYLRHLVSLWVWSARNTGGREKLKTSNEISDGRDLTFFELLPYARLWCYFICVCFSLIRMMTMWNDTLQAPLPRWENWVCLVKWHVPGPHSESTTGQGLDPRYLWLGACTLASKMQPWSFPVNLLSLLELWIIILSAHKHISPEKWRVLLLLI